jgi:hypothetical protein
MNKVERDEIFGNLKEFLKAKGIELQDGSYTQRIRRGCDLLTDTINVSGRALKQAKTAVDRKLDRVRQAIHDKTAPKPPAGQAASSGGQAAREEAEAPGKARRSRPRARAGARPKRTRKH